MGSPTLPVTISSDPVGYTLPAIISSIICPSPGHNSGLYTTRDHLINHMSIYGHNPLCPSLGAILCPSLGAILCPSLGAITCVHPGRNPVSILGRNPVSILRNPASIPGRNNVSIPGRNSGLYTARDHLINPVSIPGRNSRLYTAQTHHININYGPISSAPNPVEKKEEKWREYALTNQRAVFPANSKYAATGFNMVIIDELIREGLLKHFKDDPDHLADLESLGENPLFLGVFTTERTDRNTTAHGDVGDILNAKLKFVPRAALKNGALCVKEIEKPNGRDAKKFDDRSIYMVDGARPLPYKIKRASAIITASADNDIKERESLVIQRSSVLSVVMKIDSHNI